MKTKTQYFRFCSYELSCFTMCKIYRLFYMFTLIITVEIVIDGNIWVTESRSRWDISFIIPIFFFSALLFAQRCYVFVDRFLFSFKSFLLLLFVVVIWSHLHICVVAVAIKRKIFLAIRDGVWSAIFALFIWNASPLICVWLLIRIHSSDLFSIII